VTALLVGGVVAGCSSSALHVTPPAPSNVAAERCAHLGDLLPATLHDSGKRLNARVITPLSPLTHAWGNPAVVLRCGVPTPAGYSPTATTTQVDGVSWFQDVTASTVVWTALRPGVDVELAVPTTYDGQAALLGDLATALIRGLP
jgi:hypothetical protein